MTRDEWKELWKMADSERAMAAIEADIWASRHRIAPFQGTAVKHGMAEYVSKLLGTSLYMVRQRNIILRCGCSDFIWRKVEDGMMPSSAVAALAKVRKSLPHGASLEAAVAAELDSDVPVRRFGNRMCRLNGPPKPKRPRRTPAVRMIARFASEPASEPARADPWESARSSVCALMEAEMGGLSDTYKMTALNALKFRLDLAVGDCRRSVKRMKAEMRDCVKPPSRTEVLVACKLLGVQPPALGAPADLKAAYGARGRAAKPYHHDVNKTEAARAKFQEIMAAYETLEKHNEGPH
jgi:hypothetical protein